MMKIILKLQCKFFTNFVLRNLEFALFSQIFDPTKSVGNDNISPRGLKHCAGSLCGPLMALFPMVCTFQSS